MNAWERGFLLLCSHLGNPERKPLTTAQLRYLGQRVREMENPREDRELSAADLVNIGYGREKAQHILHLLEEADVLDYYLSQGKGQGGEQRWNDFTGSGCLGDLERGNTCRRILVAPPESPENTCDET